MHAHERLATTAVALAEAWFREKPCLTLASLAGAAFCSGYARGGIDRTAVVLHVHVFARVGSLYEHKPGLPTHEDFLAHSVATGTVVHVQCRPSTDSSVSLRDFGKNDIRVDQDRQVVRGCSL